MAFAIEDERQRDFLKGQSLHPRAPYEFIDMSVKEPYNAEWKDRVRLRIRRSDGVIVLVSKNSLTSSGQKWEIQCAMEEGKPSAGIWAYKDDRTNSTGFLPTHGATRNISSFIDRSEHMRKALIVGIDHYEHIGSLSGCVNDASRSRPCLERNADGTLNFPTPQVLTGTSPTQVVHKRDLKDAARELFADDAEIALFYFAGHGYIEDTGGFLCAGDARPVTMACHCRS